MRSSPAQREWLRHCKVRYLENVECAILRLGNMPSKVADIPDDLLVELRPRLTSARAILRYENRKYPGITAISLRFIFGIREKGFRLTSEENVMRTVERYKRI